MVIARSLLLRCKRESGSRQGLSKLNARTRSSRPLKGNGFLVRSAGRAKPVEYKCPVGLSYLPVPAVVASDRLLFWLFQERGGRLQGKKTGLMPAPGRPVTPLALCGSKPLGWDHGSGSGPFEHSRGIPIQRLWR